MPVPRCKVAVFASGNGSTFRALVEAGRDGRMPADVSLLIASRGDVPALTVADSLGVESVVLDERLPRFGGKGMFGEHVHEAVLNAGVPESAVTVHLVDAEYDTGPVIAEVPVPVLPDDDVARLQARVQAAERDLLVATVADVVRSFST